MNGNNTHLSQLADPNGKYSRHFEYQISVSVDKSNVEHSYEILRAYDHCLTTTSLIIRTCLTSKL